METYNLDELIGDSSLPLLPLITGEIPFPSNSSMATDGDYKPFIPPLPPPRFNLFPELGQDSHLSTHPIFDFFSTNLESPSSPKRPRFDPSLLTNNNNPILDNNDPQTLESIVQSSSNFNVNNNANTNTNISRKPPPFSQLPSNPTPPRSLHSELARQRRQKIGDKTRCLQKLMPWNKRMDTATMLEEAYKYVKFLQVQILALQSMPSYNIIDDANVFYDGCYGGEFGPLGMLNRQQLLEVLLNSSVAQTRLYSTGCCVVSVEQLDLLNKNVVDDFQSKRMFMSGFADHMGLVGGA